MDFRRKNNRLDLGLYKGYRVYSISICIANKKKNFTNSKIIKYYLLGSLEIGVDIFNL
jgi:hypothetical protein